MKGLSLRMLISWGWRRQAEIEAPETGTWKSEKTDGE